jgi:hypothetical protein
MNDYRNTKHEMRMRQWKMNSIGNATDKVDGEVKLSAISEEMCFVQNLRVKF